MSNSEIMYELDAYKKQILDDFNRLALCTFKEFPKIWNNVQLNASIVNKINYMLTPLNEYFINNPPYTDKDANILKKSLPAVDLKDKLNYLINKISDPIAVATKVFTQPSLSWNYEKQGKKDFIIACIEKENSSLIKKLKKFYLFKKKFIGTNSNFRIFNKDKYLVEMFVNAKSIPDKLDFFNMLFPDFLANKNYGVLLAEEMQNKNINLSYIFEYIKKFNHIQNKNIIQNIKILCECENYPQYHEEASYRGILLAIMDKVELVKQVDFNIKKLPTKSKNIL